MGKELRIKHKDITDPQTITEVTETAFKRKGLDIHRHEVTELVDDFSAKERVLKVEQKQHFVVGRVPWHEK